MFSGENVMQMEKKGVMINLRNSKLLKIVSSKKEIVTEIQISKAAKTYRTCNSSDNPSS